MLSFMSSLGKNVLIVFMLTWINQKLVSIHQGWRHETKAQQTPRWWQILAESHCQAQLSLCQSTRLWWMSPSLVSPVLGKESGWYPWTSGSELWLSPLPAPQGCDVRGVDIASMPAGCAQLDALRWVPWFLKSRSCSASSGLGRTAWKNQ